MKAYTSGLIINENTHIEKERRLPIKGEVLVSAGDTVAYDTIIAKGEIKGALATFRFCREIGTEGENIEKYLIPKIGDSIKQNDIIGTVSNFFGLFRSNIRSPYTGTLEYINKETGTIGIRLPSEKIELNSYINGTVKKIIPNEGALIESHGTLIQGIFGIGGEKFGKLVFSENAHSLNNTEKSVIVTEKSPDIKTLRYWEEKGAVGIIAGSCSDRAIKEYTGKEIGVAITGDEKTQMTIILTEGFGNIPMSKKTYDILKSVENRTVSVSGATQIRAGVIRPEIICSGNRTEKEPQSREDTLSVGSSVRIMSEPYLCRYGTITKIFDEPVKLETGSYASCAEIQLENEKVIIPRTNIEIIY